MLIRIGYDIEFNIPASLVWFVGMVSVHPSQN